MSGHRWDCANEGAARWCENLSDALWVIEWKIGGVASGADA